MQFIKVTPDPKDRAPYIPLHYISIESHNIYWLWRRVCTQPVFDPDSEEWLLRIDLLIAFKRFGRNGRRIADYVRGGREHWGPL